MKQILLPILAATVFIVLVGFLTQANQNGKLTWPTKTPDKKEEMAEITVGGTKILVELAKTETERRDGLSKKNGLENNEGMLFLFPQKNIQPPFWMKDMKFAIDIIWIDNGEIVQIDKDIQPPESKTPDEELILHTVNQPIDYVLEVNAGFAEKNNIKKNDLVDLSSIE